MSQQERIKELQNKSEMLNCQYAARFFYNRAEGYSIVSIICSLLSVLCLFIPDSLDKLGLFLPLILDLLAFMFYFLMEKAISSAALLRNHFDNTVLGLKSESDTSINLRKIQSYIFKATSKNTKALATQISNTGNDNPPGVRDWYEFSADYPDSDVVIECQKQNRWWDKEIHKRSTIVFLLILTVAISGAILLFIFSHTSWEKICACLLGLIITFVSRFIEKLKYYKLSIEIDNTCDNLSRVKDKELIKALQEKIELRRTLSVIELNIVHKKKSSQLSKEYSFISKGS